MRVNVKQLSRINNGRFRALCSTDYGDITGIWQGEELEINRSYYVELDVPQKLVWGTNIVIANSHEYRAWWEDDTTFLIARKEVYDGDGCLTFRLGDHLTLVEPEGEPISGEKFYIIRLNVLHFYPIDC